MDHFTIFGIQIPVYAFFGITGFALGLVYLFIYCKLRKKSFDNMIYVVIWAAVLGLVCSKLLYILIELKNIFSLINEKKYSIISIIKAYLSGGFVFYGGLAGAILGVILASKYFKLPVKEQLNSCIPVLPLVQGFGRIGCHFVGCCYGIEYTGILAVHYTSSSYAPDNTMLFPVQMTESVFNFLLFAVFVLFTVLRKHEDKFIYIYLFSYSIARFVLEFFRGDIYRGFFLGLSTSQWISIFIWCILLFVIVRSVILRKKKTVLT